MKKVKSKKSWKEKSKRRDARAVARRKELVAYSLKSNTKYYVFDDKTERCVKFGNCDFSYNLVDPEKVIISNISHDGWTVERFIRAKGSEGAFRPIRVK